MLVTVKILALELELPLELVLKLPLELVLELVLVLGHLCLKVMFIQIMVN